MKRRASIVAAAAALLTALGCSSPATRAEGVLRFHVGPDGSWVPDSPQRDPGQPVPRFELDHDDPL